MCMRASSRAAGPAALARSSPPASFPCSVRGCYRSRVIPRPPLVARAYAQPAQLQIDRSVGSMWVKFVSSWVCCLLYVVLLLLPPCCPGRDFRVRDHDEEIGAAGVQP